MKQYGEQLGKQLRGGEVIELIGDVGAGKTTLVKGLAVGLGIVETVQSPTFTINRVYSARDELELVHYDFYRLTDAGIMSLELAERADDPRSIVVVEWAAVVGGVLPADRLTIRITATGEDTRLVEIAAGGKRSQSLLEAVA